MSQPMENDEDVSPNHENPFNMFSTLPLSEIEKNVLETSLIQGNKLEKLNITMAKNQALLEGLRSEVFQHQMALEKLDEDYRNEFQLRNETLQLLEYCKKLEDEVAIAKKDFLIRFNSSKNQNDKKFDKWEEEIKQINNAKTALNQEIDSSLKCASAILEELKALTVAKTSSNAMLDIIKSFAVEKNRLCAKIKNISKENSLLEEEKLDSSLNEELDRLSNLKESTVHQLQVFEAEAKDMAMRIATATEQLTAQSAEIEDGRWKWEQLVIKQKSLQEEVTKDGAVHGDIKIEELLKKMDEISLEYNDKINNLRKQLMEKKEDFKKNENEAQKMMLKYSVIRDSIVSNIDEKMNLTAEALQLSERMKSWEVEKKNLLEEKSSFAPEIFQLSKEIDELEAGLAEKNPKIPELIAEVDDLLKNKQNIIKELELLEDNRRTNDSVLEKLNSDAAELQKLLDEINREEELANEQIQKWDLTEEMLNELRNPEHGEKVVQDLDQLITAWREEMDNALEELCAKKEDREKELLEHLKMYENDIQRWEGQLVSEERLKQEAEKHNRIAAELEKQILEKETLMQDLDITKEKLITITKDLTVLNFDLRKEDCMERGNGSPTANEEQAMEYSPPAKIFKQGIQITKNITDDSSQETVKPRKLTCFRNPQPRMRRKLYNADVSEITSTIHFPSDDSD